MRTGKRYRLRGKGEPLVELEATLRPGQRASRLSGAYKRQLKWIGMIIGLVVAILFNADSFKVATTLWSDSDRRASIVQAATKMTQEGLPQAGQQIDEEKLRQQITKTEGALRSLPIEWRCDTAAKYWLWECTKTSVPSVGLLQISGWLLTTAALTLGAPFWFDLLSKFVNVRGAGPKPQRAGEKNI